MLLAVLLALVFIRRRMHRSKAAHLSNVASLRPLAEFEARFPKHGRPSGRYMR